MNDRKFALPVIVAMLVLLGVNYLTGVGLAMLVAQTAFTAWAAGLALPVLSLLVLAVVWMQFRRNRTDLQR
jgi:membrane protein implicated in regulation of membrane protease activity